MKGFILFGNSLRDAIKSLTRNIGLSFASFLCMALTLTMIAVVLIIVLNIQYVIFHLEKEIDITVYLEQNISSEEIISLEEQIKNMSNVDTVEFVSKETWKELVTDDSDFLNKTLNILGENVLTMFTDGMCLNEIRDHWETGRKGAFDGRCQIPFQADEGAADGAGGEGQDPQAEVLWQGIPCFAACYGSHSFGWIQYPAWS